MTRSGQVPVVVALLLLTACGSSVSSESPTTGETVTPFASASQSQAEPTTTVDPTHSPSARSVGALAPDGLAEVVTSDLVVRTLPEISAASVIDPIRLNAPKLLFVLDGPVRADGFDWYLVAPFDDFVTDTPSPDPRLGWVAAGGDGEEWIAPWSGECPEPTVDAFRFRTGFLRVACFGDREITLEGDLGECSYITPGTVSPSWLTSSYCTLYGEDYPEGYEIVGPFWFHQEPEDFELRDRQFQPVRITGRFDHPAAQTCEHNPLGSEERLPQELIVLGCRSAFVVTDIEPR